MTTRTASFALCLLAGTVIPRAAHAQGQLSEASFAAPVRLHAGDKLLGENRLFPSPVFHDVDGDGHLDLVIGDLPGKLTVARRVPGKAFAFAAETKLTDGAGKPIDFHNW